MFDSMNINKEYTILDNVNQMRITVASFNAQLHRDSGIKVDMNITYPNLYHIHKNEILKAYRDFNSDIVSLATTMELADSIEASPSLLDDLREVQKELKTIATKVFDEVIGSLGDIQVNPVPGYDMSTHESRMMAQGAYY